MFSSSFRQVVRFFVGLGPTAVLIGSLGRGSGARADEVEGFLRSFHENLSAAMNRRPLKRDILGRVRPQRANPFSSSGIPTGEYLRRRQAARARILEHAQGARMSGLGVARRFSVVNEVDRVEDLFPGQELVRNISVMHGRGLLQGHAARDPWSDTYWPMSRGIIAYRYADPDFGKRTDWLLNFNYVRFNSASKVVAQNALEGINRLSPAEKYDLLVGDKDWTLTRTMWDKGRSYYQIYGHVDAWMGICEGWSGASTMVEAPQRTVEVTGRHGQRIRFYPSDIRALASLLWSTGKFDVHLTGSRCRVRNPARDAVGRLQSEDCFNTNPATWHLAMVNAVGDKKRGLVMDATYDFEVWNQPLYAYRYHYFNPQTLEHTDDLSRAVVPMDQFTIDKFRSYRNPQARSVVGIAMDATYAMESEPSIRENTPTNSRIVNYVYDLELDGDGNVVGGEWYTNLHPDFLWIVAPDAHARSVGDDAVDAAAWDGVSAFPAAWSAPAVAASSFAQPLAAVVEKLVALSRVTL